MTIATDIAERDGKARKGLGLGLLVSVALHLSAAALLVALSSPTPGSLQTIVANLTLTEGPGEKGETALTRGGAQRKAAGKTGPRARGRGAVAPERSAGSSPVAVNGPAEPQPAPTVTVQGPPVLARAEGERTVFGEWGGPGAGEGSGSGLSGGQGGKGSSASGDGTGQGGGSATGGLLGSKDYYYIRDQVMRNVIYPEKARRMGMEGKVLLSFIVVENGVTREVKVVHTSGFRFLDESAKEAVEKTVIPKKVPYRVAVMLPITYKLQ